MTTLTMVGWKKGLLTVSLIMAVRDYSSAGTLTDAKREVERLLDGEHVVLEFASKELSDEFQRLSEPMGVIFA